MAAGSAIDGNHFRQVLGRYPTGVAVVTGLAADGSPVGLTVGTFTSVSLDPPLVGFLPDGNSTSWPRMAPQRRFCVNILAGEQESVCRTLATKNPNKFDAIDWHPSPDGLPIIDGSVCWIECELWTVHQAGDHEIVIGEVRRLDVESGGRPLMFFQGGYGQFIPRTMATSDAGLSMWFKVLERARPVMDELSQTLSAVVTATVIDGDDEVVVATTGGTGPRVLDLVGTRHPLVAPVGLTYMAFAPAGVVEGWLRPLPAEGADEVRKVLADIRSVGYTVSVRSEALIEFERSWTTRAARFTGADLPFNPTGHEQSDQIRSVHAPILDENGDVQMILNVFLAASQEHEPGAGMKAATGLLAATIGLSRQLRPSGCRDS